MQHACSCCRSLVQSQSLANDIISICHPQTMRIARSDPMLWISFHLGYHRMLLKVCNTEPKCFLLQILPPPFCISFSNPLSLLYYAALSGARFIFEKICTLFQFLLHKNKIRAIMKECCISNSLFRSGTNRQADS